VQQRLLFPASPLRSWRQADYLIRRQVLPRWAKLRAADITRSDAKTLVAGIMAPTVANQTLAACSAIYAWAIKEESGGMSCHGIGTASKPPLPGMITSIGSVGQML
jgi:hypothetical protein